MGIIALLATSRITFLEKLCEVNGCLAVDNDFCLNTYWQALTVVDIPPRLCAAKHSRVSAARLAFFRGLEKGLYHTHAVVERDIESRGRTDIQH